MEVVEVRAKVWVPRISIRCGIHTGEVLVGNMGHLAQKVCRAAPAEAVAELPGV